MYPRVSYSALDRFEKCSTRYQLHRDRKRTEIPTEHVLVGNALHYGMAVHIDTYGAVPVRQAALWDFERRVREDKPKWSRSDLLEHRDKVASGAEITEQLVGSTFGWDPKLRSEVRLLRCFQGWAIDGYLDLMVDNGREVWDLKTGRWHDDQLVFYDILVGSVLDTVPETVGVIEPFGRGMVAVTVSDAHRQNMRERIRTFVRRVHAEDFAYEGYSSACGWCPSKPWCPKWDAARSGKLGA